MSVVYAMTIRLKGMACKNLEEITAKFDELGKYIIRSSFSERRQGSVVDISMALHVELEVCRRMHDPVFLVRQQAVGANVPLHPIV